MSEQRELRQRLQESEAMLDALRREEVDAVVGVQNVMLLRLQKAEQARRESEEALQKPPAVKTNSWPCWLMSCAIPWRRFSPCWRS
ncbi:MAG: hypothetical protein AB7P18_08285 [Candidatus Binatia bacterium]